MFCHGCGSALAPSAAFCNKCGAQAVSSTAAAVATPALRRTGILTLLAVIQFIGGALWLLVGGIALIVSVGPHTSQDPLTLVGSAVLLVLAAYQIVCGIGLWRLRGYGRMMQIALSFVGLLAFPVGTLISIAILVYLFKPGIKLLYSGRSAEEMSPQEWTAIAAVASGGAIAVLLIAGAVILVVAVIGIVAAIAVPGLLRARMSGNESAAIGSLRAINSAEASYAATAGNGGYAVALSVLAAACPGATQGFISPELSQDPTVKSGYTFTLEEADGGRGRNDCNGIPTGLDYFATAVPVTAGTTGNRAFSTSGAGTIFFDASGLAPSRAATLAATATPVQ